MIFPNMTWYTPIGNRNELLLAEDRQISALGQVQPERPVDVLATASLPRGVRVTEVALDARVGRQLRMPGHLLALVIIGKRLAHRLGNAAELGRKALQGRCGRAVRQLGQHHQARTAFHQLTHGRAVTSALDETPFLAPGKGPVASLGRAHMDAEHLGQLAPAVFPARAGHAFALCPAQTGNPVLAQFVPGHGIDAIVDGLLGDGALGIIGPHVLECVRDLRWRPAFGHKVLHHAKEHGIHRQLGAAPGLETLSAGTHTGDTGGMDAARIRHKGRTVLPGGKALELPGNGRGRAMQGTRDVACRASIVLHLHDRGSLFRGVSCS